MSPFVFGFTDIDRTKLDLAGGKGASLGELTGIEGINVPDGFCISAKAYQRSIEESPLFNELLDQLSELTLQDREKTSKLSHEIRSVIEKITIPRDIIEEITHFVKRPGERRSWAIRSSATVEDLPGASFAGQHDTYLNIAGIDEILNHVRRCWASLFTDRAVVYRVQNGFDHRKVRIAVVVQKMIFPDVSGILFTADPVTSDRKIVSIDAGFGLGEALVSGVVNPDIYKVREGKITDRKISTKKFSIQALKNGGTKEQQVEPGMQQVQALSDGQILTLESIGRKIEKHFGFPQDIEWCFADDEFYIVQSRPITTLYPIPQADDKENHVYVSVGHQQMMTDAMKPLGLSFFLLTTPATMRLAGGRLFVDITPMLASTAGRNTILNVLGKNDPLIKDAIMNILERKDFIKMLPDEPKEQDNGKSNKDRPPRDYGQLNDYDPAIVDDLIRRYQTSTEETKNTIQTKSGPELFDFILEDIQQLKKLMSDPQSFGMIMTGMNAASWLNEKMNGWLSEKNAADEISQSAPNNITSEMGLALMDVADAIRPYPQVINYLQNLKDDDLLNELGRFDGGQEVRDVIDAYLGKYGMRCVGEIDITKTRWSEKPAILVPMILSNIKNFEPGAGKKKFEQGRERSLKKEQELLERLKQLPGGEEKASNTKRMIGLVRDFIGYREYPKYGMVSRYFVYKLALLKEAEELIKAGVVREKEDIYYLSFEELHEVVRTNKLDYHVIIQRKEEFRSYEKLIPPRIITSDGEIITGKYKRENLPADVIVGLPVSSGTVEGRARAILKIEDADLEDGDILITSFTDPSWTPLFVSIKGLVTEVGGLMTHGAVIAREYGIPAVVGVENATKLIKDGERIRVNGTEGYVEVL